MSEQTIELTSPLPLTERGLAQSRSRLLLPAVGYILVSLVATWPLATHLQGWVPGAGDWGQNLWALWWTRHALLSLAQLPFFTHHLFYPEGVTLLFHPLDVSDGLLALPLYGLLGGAATYNVLVLLSFVLGGWGAYLLALDLTRHRAASFAAGLIFALSPYHFLRLDLGHLNLSTLQWIPFYALFSFRFVRHGSKRAGALAIFFLVFNALNSWYYVVYCGLLSLALLFWRSRGAEERGERGTEERGEGTEERGERRTEERGERRTEERGERREERRRAGSRGAGVLGRAGRIGLVLGGALLILLPLWGPMLRLLGATALVGAHDPLRHSVDLLSFWVPGPPSTWAGWFETVWISYGAQNREPGASAYLGYTVLGLSAVGLAARRWRRQALWWGAVGLGFSVLALGPKLQIDGRIFEIPLPYQLLATVIPAFSITGIPGRFVVMAALALAMLAAYGLAALAGWLRRKTALADFRLRAAFLYAAVLLLVGLEYLAIPVRLSRTEVADFYHIAAAEREPYAMIDIKWDANFLMQAQTVHGKPLVGGWLARLPESQAAYLNQGSLDRAFLYLLLGPEQVGLTDPAAIRPAVRAALAERDVRYIIDHNNAAGPWLARFVGWPVVYEEEGLVVYGAERR